VKGVSYSRFGGSDVLEYGQLPEPKLSQNSVIVRVKAAAINPADIKLQAGLGESLMETWFPVVPGWDLAGIVEHVGAGVAEFQPGEEVIAYTRQDILHSGTYAERVAVAADQAVPVPNGIDLRIAAAVMLQGLTAHYLCRSTFPVTEGTFAVVHAAAGGVGLLLTQLIKEFGGTVIATTSSTPKAVLAKQAGADFVTTYEDFPAVVREVTGGRGVDVVFDGVGKATFDVSLAALRRRGLMVLFGGSSGQVPPFDLQRLNSGGSLFVTRPTLAHYVTDRTELLWRAGDIFERIAKASLHVRVGAEYTLADAPRAHEDLASRRTTGKLLLIP